MRISTASTQPPAAPAIEPDHPADEQAGRDDDERAANQLAAAGRTSTRLRMSRPIASVPSRNPALPRRLQRHARPGTSGSCGATTGASRPRPASRRRGARHAAPVCSSVRSRRARQARQPRPGAGEGGTTAGSATAISSPPRSMQAIWRVRSPGSATRRGVELGVASSASMALRAARVERAARRRVERARGLAGRARGGSRRGRGRRRPAPACTGARGRWMISSAGPISTMRPRYMTAMRSATTRATDRSWVTKSTAMSELAAQTGRSRLSTDAASETSRALVGSSHSSTSRRHDGRPGQRDALALAAGQLGRRAPSRPRRAGRPARSASATRVAALGRGTRRSRSRSPIELADRQPRGQRRAGVLEHHLRRRPPRRARSCRRRARPGRRRAAAAWTCRDPLSPTSATDSPWATCRITPRSACSWPRRPMPGADAVRCGRRRAPGRRAAPRPGRRPSCRQPELQPLRPSRSRRRPAPARAPRRRGSDLGEAPHAGREVAGRDLDRHRRGRRAVRAGAACSAARTRSRGGGPRRARAPAGQREQRGVPVGAPA